MEHMSFIFGETWLDANNRKQREFQAKGKPKKKFCLLPRFLDDGRTAWLETVYAYTDGTNEKGKWRWKYKELSEAVSDKFKDQRGRFVS